MFLPRVFAEGGFTLFTALVAFLLIVLAGLLVQSMIHSESVTSDILSDVEEQVEMQAIADLARADGLQVFNYGIRYSIEDYYREQENYFLVDIGDLDDTPSDSDSWNEIVAAFAASEFGACIPRCENSEDCPNNTDCERAAGQSYGFCSCSSDTDCFRGERCCDGDNCTGVSSGTCACTSSQLSYRIAQHLLDILQIESTTFGSYGMEVDCGKFSDGSTRPCTQDLLQGTVQELINKSSKRVANDGSSEFFRVVQCDSSNCGVGTFFMVLDLRAEDEDGTTWLSDETYEKLPQITITNYATGRTIREPILPRGTFRIYVPLRLFKAVQGSLGAADTLKEKHDAIDEIYEGYCGDYGDACPDCDDFYNKPDSLADTARENAKDRVGISETDLKGGDGLEPSLPSNAVVPATSSQKSGTVKWYEYDDDDDDDCDRERGPHMTSSSEDMYCVQIRSVDIKAEFKETNTDYTVKGDEITYNVRISDSYEVKAWGDGQAEEEYYCHCSDDSECEKGECDDSDIDDC